VPTSCSSGSHAGRRAQDPERPSELELSVGFSPVVPTGSADLLDGVKLSDDGLATIGFTDELLRINNLSASAASAAFLGALRETAFQFDEVTAIEFTASGSCEAFFEFLQSTCEHIARPVDGVFGACRIIPPVELPSGAPPTVPRAYPGQPIVSWGSGEDSVRQRADEGSTSMPDGATAVEVRGYPGWIVPTGDEPLPQPFDIAWIEDGCTYAVTVAPRDGVSAAIEYAGRIGPSVAQPTPPPAEPVTVSVEEQGVRLTATVDRDRTVFGQRVIASVEILNLGPGPVFWGHSSTCPFPAHVQVHQDDARPLDPGRTDWTGDDAVLKSVTVDDVTPASAGLFEFRPESWLDFDGLMACTSDFVTSEIAEGAALTHVAAWDSEAQQGMPPPPGTYVVEATFSFLSRGAPPAFDDVSEPMHVTVPLPLTVEGPDVAYLSPGQAFDAVLADDRYRAFLADAPRTRWRQSDLAYDDGRWIATLYLSTSSRESDEVEAIVAVVDARSGEVLSVTLEERPMPAGG